MKPWTLHIPHPVSCFLVLLWRSRASSLRFLAVVSFLLFAFISPTCSPLLISWWSPPVTPVTCLTKTSLSHVYVCQRVAWFSVLMWSESFQKFAKKGSVKVFFPGWNSGIIWSPHPPRCRPSWGKPEGHRPSERLSSKFSVCCITTCSPAAFPSPQFHI